jgi:hypothetical protein
VLGFIICVLFLAKTSTVESPESQSFRGVKPILLRRPFRTASGFPELVSQCRNIVVSEWGKAVRVLMGILGMFQSLPGMLVPGQVVLLSMLLGSPVDMGGAVVQLGSSLVVLIVGSIVIASRHF